MRLTSSELPIVARSRAPIAPIARLYRNPSKRLAPIARINYYSQYGTPGFDIAQLSLDVPDSVGTFIQLSLDFSISAIYEVPGVIKVDNPLMAQPDTFWVNGNALNFYADQIQTGDEVTVKGAIASTIPLPSPDYLYVFSQNWENITVTKVDSQGLIFTPAADPDNPQTGEFTQADTQLLLHGGEFYQPRSFDPVEFVFETAVVLPDPVMAIASFNLAQFDIDFLDGIDYFGRTFIPAPNPLQPKLRQFFYQFSYLSLFLELGTGLRAVPKPKAIAQSSIGTITYTSVTELP